MRDLAKTLNQRPIAFYPAYVELTGSITSALLLSQLMYWFSKKDKFYKTDTEIMSETMLSKRELEKAKKDIRRLPFIRVSREGVPARTFYEIDWDLYVESLRLSFHKTWKQDSTKRGNKTPQNVETITKTTTKITTKRESNATRSACASRVDEPPLPASPNGSQDKGYKVEDNTDTHKINSKRFSHEDDKSIDHTSNRSNTAKPDSLNRYSRFIEEFKRYRREIKKPIKTDRPIKLFVRELEKIEAEGYDLDDALALMMEREWQTLKLDYIKGKLNKKEDEGWRWW